MRAASVGPGVLEAAMSRDGVAEQLIHSMVIARWMRLASFAISCLRRSVGKAGEALEIAHVAQCALQSFCRPVQAMEFAPAQQGNGFPECFQHVAEAFGLDPQRVTA